MPIIWPIQRVVEDFDSVDLETGSKGPGITSPKEDVDGGGNV